MLTDVFCIPNTAATGFITGEVRLPQTAHTSVAQSSVVQSKARPLVVILHGLRGFAQWGMFPHVAQAVAEAGYGTLTMNFSLNGVSRALTDEERAAKNISGLEEFTELDNFAMNTISQECDDLRTVLALLQERRLFGLSTQARLDEAWNDEVFLLAHSRGGAVAWIVAPEFAAVKRIAAWNTVAALDRFTERQKNLWRTQGFIESPNARTGQMMRQNITYLDDIERHREQYEPLKAIRRVRVPVLLVHAEQDMTVPHEHSFELAKVYKQALHARQEDASAHVSFAPIAPVPIASVQVPSVQVTMIPQTGHTFGTAHPFAGTTPALQQVLERTLAFF
jgi:pimeloyl-ACP methyl ester carboxylesterase